MLLPALSTYDPRLTAEGSLDPLGFVSTSDRLADAIWPDVTIRMRRARFLTGIAVMSVVIARVSSGPKTRRASFGRR